MRTTALVATVNLLVLGMVVLEEMLEQLHTFLGLDFVDFQQVLWQQKGWNNNIFR